MSRELVAAGVQSLSPEQAFDEVELGRAVLVDVRPASDHESAHPRGAVSVPAFVVIESPSSPGEFGKWLACKVRRSDQACWRGGAGWGRVSLEAGFDACPRPACTLPFRGAGACDAHPHPPCPHVAHASTAPGPPTGQRRHPHQAQPRIWCGHCGGSGGRQVGEQGCEATTLAGRAGWHACMRKPARQMPGLRAGRAGAVQSAARRPRTRQGPPSHPPFPLPLSGRARLRSRRHNGSVRQLSVSMLWAGGGGGGGCLVLLLPGAAAVLLLRLRWLLCSCARAGGAAMPPALDTAVLTRRRLDCSMRAGLARSRAR